MKNAPILAPAYAATLTGSNGQVIAKFRVKTIQHTNSYNSEVTSMPVIGVSPDFATLLVVCYGTSSLYLCEPTGKFAVGGYQWGTGSIFHSRYVSLNTDGTVRYRVGFASGQIKSQHAQFCGLFTAEMEKANEVTRANRAASGTRTTEERQEIASENRAAKIAKFAGKAERAEKKLATVADNLTKRYEAAKRKLAKAGKPEVWQMGLFNGTTRPIDAILFEAFGCYDEPGTNSLAAIIAYEIAETTHKLAAYRQGHEPEQYRPGKA